MACVKPIVVSASNLTRIYGSEDAAIKVVDDASFSIHAGEHIALVGPSGSGKSTLLHLIAGLVSPTSGVVHWPAPLNTGPVSGNAAVVFQAPSLVPWLNALENVMVPLLLRGVAHSAARHEANSALDLVGVSVLAEKLPEQLSGGQAQRVAIARAVAQNAQLLLADEPTGQLDQVTAGEVVTALLLAAERTGAGLLVATHDPIVAAKLDCIWQVNHGRLRQSELGVHGCD